MMYSSGNNSNGGGGGQLIEWTIIALHNKDNHNTITAGIKWHTNIWLCLSLRNNNTKLLDIFSEH